MATQPIHIAAYSFSGHTSDAAARLAELLGASASSEAIRPTTEPRGLPGFLRMGWGAIRGDSWPIAAPQPPGEGCKVLVVGTPIWAGRMPPPVRQYLKQGSAGYPAVAALVTHGGSSPARLLGEITKLSGKPAAASVALSDEDRKHDRVGVKIEAFAAAVRRLI